ncbi:MAG: nucleotidyltransferase family protein [Aggregatilineales bacterium]
MERVNTTWTADGILDFLREHRTELRAMGVTKIGLFGSYVRGEQRPDSDIDFLTEIEPFTFSTWMNAWNFLEDSFGVEVDLVPEKDLRTELRPYILPEVRYVPDF